jgi:hypothetical protein
MYASFLHWFFSRFSQPLERWVIWIIECQLDCNALRNLKFSSAFTTPCLD